MIFLQHHNEYAEKLFKYNLETSRDLRRQSQIDAEKRVLLERKENLKTIVRL
jgi:hypothetical protein